MVLPTMPMTARTTPSPVRQTGVTSPAPATARPVPDGHAVSTVATHLVAWLAAHPWLTAPALAALTGIPARTVRHQLARLAAAGRVRALLVGVAPWPRSPLYALAGPADPLPAPLRLTRAEHRRALHALLMLLATPGATPHLVARLRGEAGGPPAAGAPHPLAGLADAWLIDPAAGAGLLLRWDDGDRHAWVERAWLAALTDLAPVPRRPPSSAPRQPPCGAGATGSPALTGCRPST